MQGFGFGRAASRSLFPIGDCEKRRGRLSAKCLSRCFDELGARSETKPRAKSARHCQLMPEVFIYRIPINKKPVLALDENGSLTGNNLLSRGKNTQLPLAIESLTSVFGMGTCVSSHLYSPEYMSSIGSYCHKNQLHRESQCIRVYLFSVKAFTLFCLLELT